MGGYEGLGSELAAPSGLIFVGSPRLSISSFTTITSGAGGLFSVFPKKPAKLCCRFTARAGELIKDPERFMSNNSLDLGLFWGQEGTKDVTPRHKEATWYNMFLQPSICRIRSLALYHHLGLADSRKILPKLLRYKTKSNTTCRPRSRNSRQFPHQPLLSRGRPSRRRMRTKMTQVHIAEVIL